MWMIGRVGLLVVFIAACTSPPLQPESGEQLAACGTFPNCVSSNAQEGQSAVDPLLATPDQWQSLVVELRETENWSVNVVEDNFIQAVVATRVMRYKDDVQLQYHPERQLIHVRSSSRMGYSDMGVNRERVESLRRSLEDLQESP
ncbi:MAG: hypothetical protein ACI9NT_002183 [Bacteroidia bacterium]|jgi:uncharacterized protein (DUF1499 family)